MNILEGWNTYHFKGDILRHVSDSNHFQNNIRIIGSQDINITIQDIRFQDKSLSNIQNFLFHFDLLRYQLHDIVRKYLYTPDKAMYPTIQMKYVLALQDACSRGYKAKPAAHFFLDTLYKIFFFIEKKCPQDCLNNISSYKHARWLRHISFERWDTQLRLEYKDISVQYHGADI